jgi:hypothetical protein
VTGRDPSPLLATSLIVLAAGLVAIVSAVAGGCGVDVSLDGKACDEQGSCVAGYVCEPATRLCVSSLRSSSGSAGPGGGGTSGGSEIPGGTSGGGSGTSGSSGTGGTSGVIGNPTGPLWLAETSGVSTTLNGVAVSSDGIAYAVGANTLLVRSAAGAWETRSAGGLNLVAVAADGPNAWAVANDGRALRSNDSGASWSAPLVLTDALSGVSVKGGVVSVCGPGSRFLRGSVTASSLSTESYIGGESYVGVAMVDSDSTFLITGAGRMIHRKMAGSFSSSYTDLFNAGGGVLGLSATSDGIAWAVGGGRAERITSGGSLKLVSQGTLRSVWAKDSVEIFAVGDGATIFVRNAADAWVQQTSPVVQAFRSVSGNEANLVLVVGTSGAIVRRPP